MAADLTSGSPVAVRAGSDWLNASLGGPILKDRLYFYGSYYRPTKTRSNAANLYGELPSYDSTRNEGFGKLTFTPTKSILLNASYRESKRVETGATSSPRTPPPTTGTGYESRLKIFTADGSWVIELEELRHLQVHALREPHAGAAGQRGRRRRLARRPGTQLDIASLDTPGPVHGPDAGERRRPPTTRSSSPSSTATATRRTA